MMSHTQHPEWETLNDFVDGSIAPELRADVAAHVDTCAICRDMISRIRGLRDETSALPQTIDPPREAWAAIAAKVDAAKVVELGRVPGRASDAHASFEARNRRIRLAVAAVLLVVASSSVTAILMRNTGLPSSATTRIDQTPSNTQLVALPPDIANVERTYLSTVDELVSVLNDPSNTFAPGTIQAVQRSLKVIDAAIAEARNALLSDPASDVLREILNKSYEQKVDLLRRVSKHTTS
ncbi:MAG TPA: zf-HC2 domain-containing protein [Gemmatimonadaceae bacterium]|nr:zf-HC2 domain-containing protein [Gemmatimonadaceae bacterium]